jgi:putative NADH-flavin reductase
MTILILGATGGIGNEVVSRGLQRGLRIRALVRSPDKLRAKDPRLTVMKGDPLDRATLYASLEGIDAVIFVIGHSNLRKVFFVKDAANALLSQMASRNVRRAVFISSTLVAPGGSLLTNLPRFITRYAIQNSSEMEHEVASHDLDWTILRLVRLTNGPPSPYELFEHEPPRVSESVSRTTVAGGLLDLIDNRQFVRKTVAIRRCG